MKLSLLLLNYYAVLRQPNGLRDTWADDNLRGLLFLMATRRTPKVDPLDSVLNKLSEAQKSDAQLLLKLMRSVTNEVMVPELKEPQIWEFCVVGFGRCEKTIIRTTKEFCHIGFKFEKNRLTLYLNRKSKLMKQLVPSGALSNSVLY